MPVSIVVLSGAVATGKTTLAEKLELPGQRRSILERLRQHFAQTRDAAQLREVEKKLGEQGV